MPTQEALPPGWLEKLERIRKIAQEVERHGFRYNDIDNTGAEFLAALSGKRTTHGGFSGSLERVLTGGRKANAGLMALIDEQRADLCAHYGADVLLRNVLLYGPGSSLGWHTNEDCPGLRVYLIHNAGPGSFFRFTDESGQIITIEEPAGWHLKSFRVTAKPPLLWHAVRAACQRFALGYAITNNT